MKASDLIQSKVIDQNAQTLKEIHAEHPYYSIVRLGALVKERVDSGGMEKVSKRVGGKLIPAYRPKKK